MRSSQPVAALLMSSLLWSMRHRRIWAEPQPVIGDDEFFFVIFERGYCFSLKFKRQASFLIWKIEIYL